MLGKIEGRRRRGRQDEMAGWHHRLSGHEFEQALGVSDGRPDVLQSMGSQRVRHNWATELNCGRFTLSGPQILHFLGTVIVIALSSKTVSLQEAKDWPVLWARSRFNFISSVWMRTRMQDCVLTPPSALWCKVLFYLPQLQSLYIRCASFPA